MEATRIRSREAVRWFSPYTLGSMVLAVMAGRRRTRRRVDPGPAVAEPLVRRLAVDDAGDRWIDFFADSGDGFDATVTVASLLAAPSLQLGEHHTSRGTLLVHGGDMVYPAASEVGYRERFVGPLAAMFPPREAASAIVGIPGNHDHYDGLHAWSKLMTTGSSVGGWATIQREPFFAVELSERWWLWGVDVDRQPFAGRQAAYFESIGSLMPPGAEVILVAANPGWVDAPRTPAILDEIHALITRSGGRLRLLLTGDVHNHHRFVSTDDEPVLMQVTSGGGGAFLSPSHGLPTHTDLAGRTLELVPESVYPDPATSRALVRRAPSLLWRNGQLPLLLGALYVLVGALVGSDSFLSWRGLLGTGATLAATAAFTRRRSLPALVAAVVHAALHLGIMGVVSAVVDDSAARLLVFAVAGGTLGALAMGLAMMFAATLGINENELFSAIRVDDYRGFLRLRIDADEVLTVFAIGVNDTRRLWHHVENPAPGAPRLAPAKPVQPHLIGEPATLAPGNE